MTDSTDKLKQKRIDAKKAAQNYSKRGMSFKQSLVDSRATETQASEGKALLMERNNVRKAFMKEQEKQFKKLELLGGNFSPEQRAAFVRGKLIQTALEDHAASRLRAEIRVLAALVTEKPGSLVAVHLPRPERSCRPSADSKRLCVAPVKAPFSCPNSSEAIKSWGIAAQLTLTEAREGRCDVTACESRER
jgi:hypothetical protein